MHSGAGVGHAGDLIGREAAGDGSAAGARDAERATGNGDARGTGERRHASARDGTGREGADGAFVADVAPVSPTSAEADHFISAAGSSWA